MPKGRCRKCPGFKPPVARVNDTSCSNLNDVIEALTCDYEVPRIIEAKRKARKVPKFKLKPITLPRKGTCVPMVPSMLTRLKYISHCPIEPGCYDPQPRRAPALVGEDECDEECEKMKNVRYLCPLQKASCDILLDRPKPVVKHTTSDVSILRVSSPRTSGEIIAAQVASCKPADVIPPLPAKSGFDVFKPHSGIVINQQKGYVPDVVHVSGKLDSRDQTHKGPCEKGLCNVKKCRKYAAMKKRQMLRRKRQGHGAQCSMLRPGSKLKRKRKKQRLVAEADVCGPDDIPKQEQIQMPSNLKRGMFKTHSLTVLPCTKDKKPDLQYGILKGMFNMYDSRYGGRSRGRQALTMSVMSYCLAFHYHPKQWTMKLLDNLMDAADKWYAQCLEKVHDHSAYQGICEVLQFGKRQVVSLNGKKMQILFGEPEVVGYTMSRDPTVYNLRRGLKAFFIENRAGVLLTRILKLAIWRDSICYYIFDPAGRDNNAFSNFATGQSALINVKDLDDVTELILGRSVVQDQKFVLAPIKVLRMVDERLDEDFPSEDLSLAEKAMLGYKIQTADCAIVNANMHLGDRCFEDAKFRQAIPIAVVAMTYAKISPPNTWFTKTLDKILRLGNKLYLDCVQPKVMVDLTIDNIPNVIVVGPYAAEIIIYRERVKGQLFSTKECLFNINSGLEDFFSHEYNCGILEFNNYCLAIWRQKDMFYLFDPYPRTIDGLRSTSGGRACCLMLLNPETMANVFTKNWDFLPQTTLFIIHAFKVLKLKKKEIKTRLVCTLSDEHVKHKGKVRREVLEAGNEQGDGQQNNILSKDITDIMPVGNFDPKKSEPMDEERMGDIISLVDSIQEEYVPRVPLRYKNLPPEQVEVKVVSLDSPTVSVTQVVPPWPRPRDKSHEAPEPDPPREPTPPPTPPTPPPPEGEEEEEEKIEEEEDEETMELRKEEEALRKAQEEEERRKAEELPPPFPPPPPSPQPEEEVPLAPIQIPVEEEDMDPVPADKHVLLTEDAKGRYRLRQQRKKISPPLDEDQDNITAEQELAKPTNFKNLPDNTQIIRGYSALCTSGISAGADMLPFGAIMAVVTSYKYSINTWTPGIVDFVVSTAKALFNSKLERFQLAPIHVIPKISLGHQTYHASIDVIGEGASWQLADILEKKLFARFDRGMATTSSYSCAIFKKNGLYYLFDGSTCNAMGLRASQGKACFLRFTTLKDLVIRILYNKDGPADEQQFIISRIVVRNLLQEPLMRLPEDYDYDLRAPRNKASKSILVESGKAKKARDDPKTAMLLQTQPSVGFPVGYQYIDGVYRIEGSTTVTGSRNASSETKPCHFVSLIAMLMATMHPVRTWNQLMIDTCIEKGLEIHIKATNLNICEKRVIKNVILDGKFINVNIKKIIVINENREKRLDQYLRAVLKRLRYVIIRYPQCSMVICQTDGYIHLFDPYSPPAEDPLTIKEEARLAGGKTPKKGNHVATWTLYRNIDGLIRRLTSVIHMKSLDSPEFFTFELTSVKSAPRNSALQYKLSPLFKPHENPNAPYLKGKKLRPLIDEKMYWLNAEYIPWSRMNATNDLGFERKTPKTMWKDWDIEFPGDLYSLWGTIHPADYKFGDDRGKQYLAVSVIAVGMAQACELSAWTSGFIDGIVNGGHMYHMDCVEKIGNTKNHEVQLTDLSTSFNEMYPYSFKFSFENIIFGFVYNMLPDRFNLSRSLSYFFEKHTLGILTSPSKNLAFGLVGGSYFMFDCQSYGAQIFSPGSGVAYILKCESLNRLIYCMTMTLNIRRHGQQFHLYSVNVKVNEKS